MAELSGGGGGRAMGGGVGMGGEGKEAGERKWQEGEVKQ